MNKRLIALLLALALMVSCLPVGVLAVGEQSQAVVVEDNHEEPAAQVLPENSEAKAENTQLLAGEHSHTCEDCSDSSVVWTAWDKTDSLPTSGHYYLTQPVTVSAATTLVNKELVLCLNGQTITAAARAYRMSNGAKLTICDCTKGGKILAGSSIGGAVAVFKDAATDANCTLKMYDITVEGVTGKTPTYGGGVLVNCKGTTALIKGVTFKNLTIAGGSGSNTGGAAVYMSEGTATNGSLTMDGCTITGCVDSSSGTSAAVRALQVKNVHIKNCTFTNNQNTATGASALMLSGGNATLEGCTITGNKSTATSDWCGGVYVYDGTNLTIKGKNIIENNTINNGANPANLVLQETTANQEKKVIHFADVDASSVLNIKTKRGTTDPNKFADVTSGEAFVFTYEVDGKTYRWDKAQSKFVVQDHVHTDGYADAPVSAAWEPWTSTNSLPTSGYYYLTEDVVLTGAKVLNTNGAQLTLCLNGHTVTAPAAGRVFRVSNGHDLTVCDHTKTGTLYAGAANGGAISLVTDTGDAGYCDLKVFDITIEGTAGNTPTYGGAISCTNPHNNATLKNVTFKNLTTVAGADANSTGGSAVFFYTANSDGKLIAEGCTFTGCTDNGSDMCGTVRVRQAAVVDLKNCTFQNNTASGVGASAINLSGVKDAKMEGCTVTGNTSTGTTAWAGAVYVFASSQLTLVGKNTIENNTIQNGAAAADLVLVENASGTTPVFLHFSNTDPSVIQKIIAKRGTTDPNALIDVTAGDDAFSINYGGKVYYYDTVQDKFVLGHRHTDAYAGVDGSVEWKAWTKTDSLPTEAGYWYLTKDVTLTSRFAEIKTDSVYVCLNGKTVTAKAKGSDNLGTNVWRMTGAGKLTVCDCTAKTENGTYTAGKLTGSCMGAIYTLGNLGATINFYDGIISGNWTEGTNSGAGICIQTGSTLNMYGGLITNNQSNNNGGAIYNSGIVNIFGGKITNNTAAKIAGGIYAVNSLTIKGDTVITGNAGGDTAGGVFYNGGTLTISGDPQITGNTLNGAANNLYLAKDRVITLGTLGSGTAKIGVSVSSDSLPRTVSGDMGGSDCSAYFVSDMDGYEIVNKDNKLHIQATYKHLHDHGYAGVDGSAEWKAWDKTDSLPTTAGYWYLTKDVNLTTRFAEIKNEDVFLCLNGKTVTARAAGTDGNTNVYRLTGSGNLTICDCCEDAGTVTGASMGAIFTMTTATGTVSIYDGIFANNTTNDSGAVAVMQNTTKLHIYGGEFKNNTATKNGGAIYLGGSSSAIVSGGTFTGNHAPMNGGAIYVMTKLDLQGGTFTGNTAGSVTGNNGAAIFFGGTELKISGNPQITGNTVGGAPNNLYLATGKSIILGTMASGTDKVGVKVAFNTLPRTISGDMGANDCSAYFTCDTEGYEIVNKDNALHIQAIYKHLHDHSYAGVDGTVAWQAWTSKTTLPTTEGYWYLTEDVNLDSRFAEISTAKVYVCLNGHTVTAKAKGSDGMGTNIWRLTGAGKLTICDCTAKTENGVYTAGKLTGSCMGAIYTMNNVGGIIDIYDGIITGNKADGNNSGAGVVVQGKCRLNIHGGLFTGNTAGNNGGVIYNAGTTYIYNGIFTNNTAAANGGAIYSASDLYILGGTFTGNSAVLGGGVFTNGGVLGISGTPEIKGNTANGAANNLYLATGKVITLGAVGAGEARIGISVAKNTVPRYISTDMGANDCSAYFFSDDSTVGLSVKDNKLYLGLVTDHKHCDCGGLDSDLCDDTKREWFPWTDANSLPTSGSWYLDTDVTVADVNGITVTGDLWLCLNGHTIDGNGHVIMKIRDAQHDVLISDCDGKGEITNGTAANYGAIYLEKGTYTMFGGKFTNNHCTQTTSGGWAGGAIQARGDLTLVGVTFEGNTSGTEGGAICMRESAKAYLEDCTFKNNEAANGGAIYQFDARNEVTVKDCTFEGNTATKDGGAILTNAGKLIIEGESVFTKNTAGNCGGAVLVMGTGGNLHLKNGKFTENKATSQGGAIYVSTRTSMVMDNGEIIGNSAKSGGGINLLSSKLTMNGGKINENTVTQFGGAIFAEGAELELKSGTISKNHADVQGGGLYGKYRIEGESYTSTVMNLSGVMITKNTAPDGAGIATIRYTKINLTAGRIEENEASNAGGGVLLQTWSEMTISGTGLVDKNTSEVSGGGIYVSSESTLTLNQGGKITENVAASQGGGIFLLGGTFTMNEGTVWSNTASCGGGVYAKDSGDIGSTVLIKGGNFSSNVATDKSLGGGGMTLYGKNTVFTMEGGYLQKNQASNGGGVLAMVQSKVEIKDGSVYNNTAERSGGGIYISTDSSMVMEGGKVTNNSAKTAGGGIYLLSAELTQKGGSIQYNTTDNYGAGIHAEGSVMNLKGGQILGNEAKKQGGGIYAKYRVQKDKADVYSKINLNGVQVIKNRAKDGAGIATIRYTKVYMTGGSLSNNVADASAGGILLQSGSSMTLSGGAINGNVAKKGSAGGVYASTRCSFTMRGGSVSNNQAKVAAGGVYLMYAPGDFTGGKIQGNKTPGEAGGLYVRGSKATLDGTDILDNEAKNGGGISTVRYPNEKEGIDAMPELIIKSGRIAGNKATNGGGMILQSKCETKMLGGSIENNYTKSYGGGVYVSQNHTFTVTGGKINNNTSDGWGGGVYHLRGSNGHYENMELSYNKAKSIGGGIIINGTEAQPSSVVMKKVQIVGNEAREGAGVRTQDRFQSFQAESCNFKDNKATNYAGGLMIFFGLENVIIKDCAFENNVAETAQGGGVYIMSALVDCEIVGCTFKGNTAGTEGGAMWTQGGLLVKDCTFDDNHAVLAGGAIATDVFANTRVRHPVLYVEGCDITNNTSGTNGGGIYADTASYISVTDTVISGNSSKAEGGGMWIVDDSRLESVTITGNRSGGEGYALYYHASEFDGLSYIRGAHRIGGEMIVKDNQGGDMYIGNQTGIAVSDKGLTGNTYMNIRLFGGYLTQLLRGAYNYEGGDTVYTVTPGNRSITEPEVYALAADAPEAENAGENLQVAPAVVIGGVALAVALIAIVVLILLVSKRKKAAAKK